ncbi:MAG TPA: hypothetical protein ENK43_14785 [Planctomycetes bacterium]|nr:hypothetical protein [Planctomycetota bacterium]
MKLDTNALREDFRKVGLGVFIAGVIGAITGTIHTGQALLALVVGTGFWIAGLVQMGSEQ